MNGRPRRLTIVLVISSLYLVTWIGGWVTYQHDFRERIDSKHAKARQRYAELAAFAEREGLQQPAVDLYAKPTSHVDWCVPILPGVLIADSSYVCAPLWGEGGWKIVLYYGWGTFEVPVANWRA